MVAKAERMAKRLKEVGEYIEKYGIA